MMKQVTIIFPEGITSGGLRCYNAQIGRWLSVDPFEDMYAGISPYNYCANNPINVTDPDGGRMEAAYDMLMQTNITNMRSLISGDPFAALDNALAAQMYNAYMEKLEAAQYEKDKKAAAAKKFEEKQAAGKSTNTPNANNNGTGSNTGTDASSDPGGDKNKSATTIDNTSDFTVLQYIQGNYMRAAKSPVYRWSKRATGVLANQGYSMVLGMGGIFSLPWGDYALGMTIGGNFVNNMAFEAGAGWGAVLSLPINYGLRLEHLFPPYIPPSRRGR